MVTCLAVEEVRNECIILSELETVCCLYEFMMIFEGVSLLNILVLFIRSFFSVDFAFFSGF